MTEPNTEVEPVEPVEPTPLQPSPEEPAPTPPEPTVEPPVQPIEGSSEYEVMSKRLTGAFTKLEELTIANRELTEKLADQSSTIEQLNLQLTGKDLEAGIVVGERDKLLTSQSEELVDLRTENVDLKAYKRKVEMIIELDRPELVKALHIIPNMTDDDALRAAMTDVLGFRDDGALQRERELTSGVVEHTPVLDAVSDSPTTEEGWDKLINATAPGSAERQRLLSDKGDWLFKGPQLG